MGLHAFRELFRRHPLIAGALVAGAVALMRLLLCFDPEAAPWYPPCLFREVTGFFCFGCGNTRALHLLLHGDLAGSLQKNLLLIPSCAFLLMAITRPHWVNRPGVLGIAAAVIIGFTLLRNLPWEPFCLLAPH